MPKRRQPKPKQDDVVHRKAVEDRKEESMRIRIAEREKALLVRAAARVGLGVSAFMLSAALEKARAALGE